MSKQSPKFFVDLPSNFVVFSPNTLIALNQALLVKERDVVVFDLLQKVKNQIDGQLIHQTKGRLSEFLANKLVIEELKNTNQEGSEGFLSGKFFTGGRYSVDRFLGHAEQDKDGSTIIVVDKVFEVKSSGYISRASIEIQIKNQLSRIRSSDNYLNIDTYPVKIRISEKTQYLIIAPKDVISADKNLPFTVAEIGEEVDKLLHDELCERYKQEDLDWLFYQLIIKNLLSRNKIPQYERILLGRKCSETK